MTTKLMKAAVIMLAAIALLATAGAVSADPIATSPVTLSLGVSTGQIIAENGSYEGYVYIEPKTTGTIAKVSSIWYDLENVAGATLEILQPRTNETIPAIWNATPVYNGNKVSIPLDHVVDISAKTAIGVFKITPGSTQTDDVPLNLSNDSYVYAYTGDSVSEKKRYTGNSTDYPLTLAGYTLSNLNPNTIVKASTAVPLKTEACDDMFNEITLFSELSKEMDAIVSPYAINFTSLDTETLTLFIDTDDIDEDSNITEQKYVVLKGKQTVDVTAKVTKTVASGDPIAFIKDPFTFSITTAAADIEDDGLDGASKGDFFNYYADKTYNYTGESVANKVIADVIATIKKHNAGHGAVNGYDRVTSEEMTIKCYPTVACSGDPVDPIDEGKYYFKITTLQGNDNYDELSDYEIKNNSFTIVRYVLEPVFTQGTFNATNPAKLIATYDAGANSILYPSMKFETETTVPKFEHARYVGADKVYSNTLQLPAGVLTAGTTESPSGLSSTSVTLTDATKITITASTSPTARYSEITFTGKCLGDINCDGYVDTEDASYILTKLTDSNWIGGATPTITEAEKLYGNIYINPKITSVDARAIAQYTVGLLDESYQAL